MMKQYSKQQWLDRLEELGYPLEIEKNEGTEFAGACIICESGKDRFVLTEKGDRTLIHCRICEAEGEYDAIQWYALVVGTVFSGAEESDGTTDEEDEEEEEDDSKVMVEPDDIYYYYTADGEEVMQARRFDNGKFGDTPGTKDIMPFNPLTRKYGLSREHRHLPYNLPQIMKPDRKWLFIPEGEKCCDSLTEIRATATTNIGAVRHWTIEHCQYIPEHLKITVLPDADKPGYYKAVEVGRAFSSRGNEVYVLPIEAMGYELQEAHGLDVADWLMDKTAQDFANMVRENLIPFADWFQQIQGVDGMHFEEGMPRRDYAIRRIVEESRDWLLFVKDQDDSVLVRWGDNNTYPTDKNNRENRVKRVINRVKGNIERPIPEGHPDRKLDSFATPVECHKHFDEWAFPTVMEMPDLRSMVSECHKDDLDRHGRYIGVLNGILDLKEGRLLSPKEIRDDRIFVTQTIDTTYEEDALEKYPKEKAHLDKLFKYVEDPDYFKQMLATHLYGHSLKRVYFVIGPPDGGKSAILNLYSSVFSPYVVRLNEDVFRDKEQASAGLSPEMANLMKPSRLGFVDDLKVRRVDPKALKQLTDSEVNFRSLHKDPQTGKVRATIFLAFNDASPPKMDMEDPGLQSRVRCIFCRVVPDEEKEGIYAELGDIKECRKVVLRDTVEYTKQVELNEIGSPKRAVPDTEIIINRTQEFFKIQGSPLADLCNRMTFTKKPEDVILSKQLWIKWCEINDEPITQKWVENYSKHTLTNAVNSMLEARGMPLGSSKVISSSNSRGWRGWTIL